MPPHDLTVTARDTNGHQYGTHAVMVKHWGSKRVFLWFLEAKGLKNRLKVA